MFEDKSTLIASLRNPMNVASMALAEIQERLGGTHVVADPNSPFCHLLEFGSSINAACIQAVDETLPGLFSQRAESMEDLYHHMSDYDYLKLYSNPAQVTLTMILPKRYLATNAETFNSNYKKVTIPKDTIFMIGRYSFGLYYPIDILINTNSGTFTVVYDTSVTNPLHALTKNLIDKYDETYRGMDCLMMNFPVYQFSRSIIEESAIGETGFAKKYVYNDKFYAVRIFSYKDKKYTELAQTESKVVYDVQKPTALVRVLPEEQKVKIVIPQIYFDQGVIGSKLYIEFYTTMGDINIDTTSLRTASIAMNFKVKSKDTTNYSTILNSVPFDIPVVITSDNISGGSDAIDVDTLRYRVVNDMLYDSVPITENDLSGYLEDNDFYLRKYIDNVTDRIYYAYRVLQDATGAIVPSISLPMQLKASYTSDHSSFVGQSDDSITILPTTIYKYNSDTNDCTPLTDDEMAAIGAMDKKELCETLNNSQYFKSPYHLRVSLANRYPEAISYDLMSPKVNRVMFDAENYDIALKMITFEAYASQMDDGVGGYRIEIAVYKSDDVLALDENNLLVYITTKTSNGYWVGLQAEWVQKINETRDLYRFDIDTNYHLSESDEIAITNFQNETIILSEHMIPLTTDFHIVFMVRRSAVTGEYGDSTAQIVEGVPDTYNENYVALSRQYINITLGRSLGSVIRNNIEVSNTTVTYATWDHDVPLCYEEDVYTYDSEGNLVYETDDEGNMTLKIAHKAGEQYVDTSGKLVYLHKTGDVRYDAAGEPVVAVDRDKLYYVDMMFIDAKVFASEKSSELDFVSEMYNTLAGYFNTIYNLHDQLLERTQLYFRCVRSTGTATFNLGDGVTIKESVELSFKINCYVPSYVKKSEAIQETIRARTCEAIDDAIKTKTISMLEIFQAVKSKLSDYIDHFDLLGINGISSLQTFTILDEDAQPSIARKLVLTEDNVLLLDNDIDITFVVLDDNTAETTTISS